MGMYDELPNGAQVKCWWNELRRVKRGDEVPALDGLTTYQIALIEGDYAQVQDGRFLRISKSPRHRTPIYDKWGDPMPEMYPGYLMKDWEKHPPRYQDSACREG